MQDAIDGKFGEQQVQESKLLAFQKLDKVLEPSLKGLVQFTRGYADEDRLKLRLGALDCSKSDLQDFAQKYLMSAIEARVQYSTIRRKSAHDTHLMSLSAG